MKKLIVFYDSSIFDMDRDFYLGQIKKHIENVEIIDISMDWTNNYNSIVSGGEMILVLKPIPEDFKTIITNTFSTFPDYDIEGAYTGQLTITAEAIIRVINKSYDDLNNLKVLIVNKSETVGIPLSRELVKNGAKTLLLNSKSDVFKCIRHYRPDVIVTATGNPNFKIPGYLLSDIDLVIDLSHDTNLDRAIRGVPTIKVLKERLENESE